MPGKGRPILCVRLDSELLALLKIEAERHGSNLPTFVRAVLEAHLRGLAGVYSPPRGVGEVGVYSPPGGVSQAGVYTPSWGGGEATLRKAVIAQLKGLLGQLRFEIASVDVPRIREKRVDDLSQAIDDLSILSKAAAPEHRLRIYQLLGYLCMVLDGVLNNVTKGELLQRLEQVEERMDVRMEEPREAGETSRGQDNLNT